MLDSLISSLMHPPVHSQIIAAELKDWVKQNRISGYTTLQVHLSYGEGHGAFQADAVSGEKYYTSIFFEDKDGTAAKHLKAELKSRGFFTLLTKLEEK